MPTTSPGNNKPPGPLFPPSGKVEADLPKNNTKRIGVWAALGGTVAVTSAALAFVSGSLGIPLLVGTVGVVAGYAFAKRNDGKTLEEHAVKIAHPSTCTSQLTSPAGPLLEHPPIWLDFSPKYPAAGHTHLSVPESLDAAFWKLSEDAFKGKSWDRESLWKFKHLMEKIDDLPLEKRVGSIRTIQKRFQTQSRQLLRGNIGENQGQTLYYSSKKMGFIETIASLLDIQVSNVNAELALREEIKRHKAFKGFPPEELWRLVVSSQDHEIRGKYGNEHEPGYLAGCFNMLTCMLKRKRQMKRMDSGFLITLHDTLAQSTYLSYNMAKTLQQGIGINKMGLSLRPGINLSEGGLKEMKESMHNESELSHKLTQQELDRSMGVFSIITPVQLRDQYSNIHMVLDRDTEVWDNSQELEYNASFLCKSNQNDGDSEQIKANIQTLIDQYYDAIKQAETPAEKEKAIAFYMAKIVRIQPFPDGNLRTIAFGAVNLLRLEQGLLPLIWENPSQLEGFSSEELVKIQQEGAVRFESMAW